MPKVILPFKVIPNPIQHDQSQREMTGQTLYTKGDKASLAIMDKQIYRLLGKATTLAAYVLEP